MSARVFQSPLHQPAPHESAVGHVTGAARYADDLAFAGLLHGWPVPSPHAHARIAGIDTSRARAIPGVHAVLTAADVPGDVWIGPIAHDEAFLAAGEVHHVGHPVALVVAESREIARIAADAVEITWEVLPAIRDVEQAVAAGSYHGTPHVIARGDVAAALAAAPLVVSGTAYTPGQDHFYLETHCAVAIPEEDGAMRLISSTQHPTEVQKLVAVALGVGAHRVICEVPRMGGGFGGKETQAAHWAALAALAAHKLARPVKVWLDRGQDMGTTGKRHPFFSTWKAGFERDGTLLALEASLVSDGGFSLDLSGAILDRALFHLDNAYFVPALRFEGRVARTHRPSNTAFRGFGGPQGMVVVEHAIEAAAEALGLDPAEVRRKSYYRSGRDRAPYGQAVGEARIEAIHDRLVDTAGYRARRAEIERYNASSPWTKRGIALQPIKFGISFTNAPLNQAGALVHVYTDGSVLVSHGGTEMGQGLHTKIIAVASDALGVSPARIRVGTTCTDKVPNTSATAASSGSDLNGAAVRAACETLRGRLAGVAAQKLGCAPEALAFAGDAVSGPDAEIGFADLAKAAWLAQVSLSATGYYRTPGIGYDREAGRGTPFFYFAWGAAVIEVALNGLTGEHRLVAVDILHDVGDSLVPSIDIGQVEGAFIQGWGWLTIEDVAYRPDGAVLTRGPSTYKIPTAGDVPERFRVELLKNAGQPGTIGGSKAVGEPPLMLAIGVFGALRHAISGFPGPGPLSLALPAHPEHVLAAVERRRGSA
jgi:xanthine dehydrogenase large subunit